MSPPVSTSGTTTDEQTIPASRTISPPTTSQSPRLRTPITNSIPLLNSLNGEKQLHVHTSTVTLLFILQFRLLVKDPLRMMLWDLFPLALVQSAYCAICMPDHQSWENVTLNGSKERGTFGESNERETLTKPDNDARSKGTMRRRPHGMMRRSIHNTLAKGMINKLKVSAA